MRLTEVSFVCLAVILFCHFQDRNTHFLSYYSRQLFCKAIWISEKYNYMLYFWFHGIKKRKAFSSDTNVCVFTDQESINWWWQNLQCIKICVTWEALVTSILSICIFQQIAILKKNVSNSTLMILRYGEIIQVDLEWVMSILL